MRVMAKHVADRTFAMKPRVPLVSEHSSFTNRQKKKSSTYIVNVSITSQSLVAKKSNPSIDFPGVCRLVSVYSSSSAQGWLVKRKHEHHVRTHVVQTSSNQ